VIVPRLGLGAAGARRAPLSHQCDAGGSRSGEAGKRLAVQRQAPAPAAAAAGQLAQEAERPAVAAAAATAAGAAEELGREAGHMPESAVQPARLFLPPSEGVPAGVLAKREPPLRARLATR
jgi:hypothetical protein